MSSSFLIVDGYNLMHAAGLARATYGPGDLARKRHELLVRLARRLAVEERKRCTVVFDAIDAPPDLPHRFRHDEITVLFAKPGHEADEVIESLISQNSAPKRLTVVSSDHRIQNAIRRRRGNALDSEVFLKQLESPHRQIGPVLPTASRASDTAGELEFWITEFETLSPDALNEEIQAQSGEKKSEWESRIEQLQQQIQDPSGLDAWLNEPSQGRSDPKSNRKT